MANIKLNNNSYPIPDSALAAPTADFVAHLGTIAGSGMKVVVGGVEYGVDATKVAGAVSGLEGILNALEPIIGYSDGLEFTSNNDGTCYVSGIGVCSDSDIVVPPTSPDGDSVTSIGREAFFYCESLTSISIPEGVTSIGDNAFTGCKSLTSIMIPTSVTNIGYFAFNMCELLASITIPNSVTDIYDGAFTFCMSLESIRFEGTVAQWNSVTKGRNWNDEVPATHVQCSDGQVAL